MSKREGVQNLTVDAYGSWHWQVGSLTFHLTNDGLSFTRSNSWQHRWVGKYRSLTAAVSASVKVHHLMFPG